MVHRAPDSRLLTNLIHNEKEYAKQLAALFPLSHAALASLSAYAAASPSSHPTSPAHTIAAVVDTLASADDALQRYTHAIDTWREQLVSLKALEEDLSSVLRDRDILVTRLIKASKSTRDAHRSSRLVVPLSGVGSASFSSLPSTNSTGFSTTGSSPASTNAKLAQAQAELQACEAHLVSKERELDARRIILARDGLGARCRALIDCGWVWSEMGKQGLRVLQALNADASTQAIPKQSPTVPLQPSMNLITYASDISSLTPSQSASQTAARSAEASQEDPSPKEHDHAQPTTEQQTTFKPQARSTRANEDGDHTNVLRLAHAASESELASTARSQNGDSAAGANSGSSTHGGPSLRRRRTKRTPRPPSQHITEASDEGSDASPSRNVNATASPRERQAPYPTVRASETHDTSSDDEPTGPLQVVENDPFEVIRRSMLGTAGSSSLLSATAPIAHASAPDVRTSVIMDISPSKVAFPGFASLSAHGHEQARGIGVGSPSNISPTKRQRRPSIAFFGSLRGLFRKPKERERLMVEWDETPSPASPSQRTKTSGWVTRTDVRIKARGGEDSDEEPTPTITPTRTRTTASVVRTPSGARLRKGRPGPALRENGPSRVPSRRTTMDGWITDNPGSTGGADARPGRSRTPRRTVKRNKTSVADLRGSDQGHTDGEVDGERQSLERVSSKGKGNAPDVSALLKPVVEEVKPPAMFSEANTTAVPKAASTTDLNTNPSTNVPKRATTTTAASIRKPSPSLNVAPAHRRSASLSLADAHPVNVSVSTSTSSQTTSQSMSWRKPPPQVDSPSRPASPPPTKPSSPSPSPSSSQIQAQAQAQAQAQPSSRAHDQSKSNARRQLGNGHAKHVQNQSLMSIVADVTRQSLEQDRDDEREREPARVTDRSRSLDIPRAPGFVLRSEREAGGSGTEALVNGRAHVRATSEDVRGGSGSQVGQGHGPINPQGQRVVKMPLRSALRNTSRTPSPSPGPPSALVPTREVNKEEAEEERGRVVSPLSLRDSVSISSYETGRESLDGEKVSPPASSSPLPSSSPSPSPERSPPLHSHARSPVPRSESQPSVARSKTPSPPPTLSFTFPPPPVDPPPAHVASEATTWNLNRVGSEPPSSSASTETPPVHRRKSVRVSLQPTFSPTPPASLDDEEDDGEQYAPWSGSRDERGRGESGNGKGNGKGKGKSRDKGEKVRAQAEVWMDSSEEEETYRRARRLLSLSGRAGV